MKIYIPEIQKHNFQIFFSQNTKIKKQKTQYCKRACFIGEMLRSEAERSAVFPHRVVKPGRLNWTHFLGQTLIILSETL